MKLVQKVPTVLCYILFLNILGKGILKHGEPIVESHVTTLAFLSPVAPFLLLLLSYHYINMHSFVLP